MYHPVYLSRLVRVFLALPLIDISLPFFPRVFLIVLSPVFLRLVVAFFAGAGVFLRLPGLFFNFPVHKVADEAFLAPTLAAFLEPTEFGAAIFLRLILSLVRGRL